MKLFLKGIIFTYIALISSQHFFKTFVVFDDKTMWMVLVGLSLLNMFKRPPLEMVSLPAKGVFFQLISTVLTVVLLFILVAIFPNFRFVETQTPGFNILGFMLPSTYLSAYWSAVATGIEASLVSNFLYWLSAGKKGK